LPPRRGKRATTAALPDPLNADAARGGVSQGPVKAGAAEPWHARRLSGAAGRRVGRTKVLP